MRLLIRHLIEPNRYGGWTLLLSMGSWYCIVGNFHQEVKFHQFTHLLGVVKMLPDSLGLQMENLHSMRVFTVGQIATPSVRDGADWNA